MRSEVRVSRTVSIIQKKKKKNVTPLKSRNVFIFVKHMGVWLKKIENYRLY